MDVNYLMTVVDVAKELGCSKSYVQRLIKNKRLDAAMQEAPVRYYLVSPASVKKYKNTPKNKGGRPRGVKSS